MGQLKFNGHAFMLYLKLKTVEQKLRPVMILEALLLVLYYPKFSSIVY